MLLACSVKMQEEIKKLQAQFQTQYDERFVASFH